jgi:hypothetical protein
MTIRIMGALKMHLRQYCGPERTPPGCSGSAQIGNGFMIQDTSGRCSFPLDMERKIFLYFAV